MNLYERISNNRKLSDAWNRVKKNKPACGVDNITYEEFDNNSVQEIKQLEVELKNHEYEVMPVKMVAMRKENKMREISLYSMRDKVVQAAIATELNVMYEKGFSRCTFSYRSDLSALLAIERIEEKTVSGQYTDICKTDIKSFFDNISLEKLERILSVKIKETDALELIMAELRTPSVGKDGELIEKNVGIYQGSGISPVLSNVYLDSFDKEMEKEPVFFVRYADDMLILAKNRGDLDHAFTKMKDILEDLELSLNEDKTYIRTLAEGFDFLGYHFDNTGRSIPGKAEQKLETGLEDVWYMNNNLSLEDKLRKCSQILNGWEQYYRNERDIKSFYEFVVVMYMMRYSGNVSEMAVKRQGFKNINKDILKYLISIWKECDLDDMILFEYEQYFEIKEKYREIYNDTYKAELLELYSKLIILEDKEVWTEVMQSYSDQGLFDEAEKVMERINRIEENESFSIEITNEVEEKTKPYTTDMRTIKLYEEVFVGREDMYSREYLTTDKNRKCEFVPEPLTADVIKKHFEGTETIGTYLIRNNDTVHFMVWDVDISKKILLSTDKSEFDLYLQKAANTASNILGELKNKGMKGYVEFSGYRGYHVWLFCSEWIPIRYAFSFMENVASSVEVPDGISLELFPVQNKRKAGNNGQTIKMPLGLHMYSGKRSYFCNSSMENVEDINDFLSTLAKYSLSNIRRAIGASERPISSQSPNSERLKVEIDYEKLGNVPESVLVVLKSCSLMQYLVNKAMTTGYLTHFERLSVLHVFGHVGEDGKEFVHTVMSFTLNYQFTVTQRFIDRIPAKPVSCIKLREQYKQITAEYGCSCNFKRTKDCYPSPVIHALKYNTTDDKEITIPTSRTITQEKKNVVYDELNVHNRVQELASKIVELKKQKRGIDKSIKKVETDLCHIFDSSNVDCIEVDMGMLVRKKKDDGYEWIIEI